MTLRQSHKEIYWAWKSMKQRCQNPKCDAYRNYGARGISVCEEWQRFEPFLEWSLANGHKKGLDLDRKDNDGNYCPSNCRWISRRENINNRRNTILISVGDESLPDTVWADRIGVDRALLKMWLNTHGHEYTAARIQDALQNGYTPRDFGYSHRKAIRHVDSGKSFRSVREAAQHFGLAPCTISNAMREGRKTGKGRFEWEELS